MEQRKPIGLFTKPEPDGKYTYDESGLRTRKYNGSEYTYYDRDASGNLVHEARNDGANHLYYYYDANGNIGSISDNGVRYAFLKNLQGDVIVILDTSGNVVARYTYDAWGKVLSVTDANGNANTSSTFIGNVNPIRYRGYYYDTETGWYYLNSRYYDPEVKRFINADDPNITRVSLEDQGWDKNLFAYCDNNPVTRADDGGGFWHIVAGGLIGGIISGATKIVTNLAEGKEWNENLAASVLAGGTSGILAATSAGLSAIVLGNAAISMAENASNQIAENGGLKGFDVTDMLYDGAIGAAAGAVGGPGSGSKHLTNLGKQTVSRTRKALTHNGVKAAVNEGKKVASYYAKSTTKYYKNLTRNLWKDCISSATTSYVTSNSFKSHFIQYGIML